VLELAYGRSSQRIWCPHQGTAVPSGAVSITILDDDGNEVLASTSATKGSLSTSLASAAAAGAKSITTSNAAGCSPGDPIVLTDAQGRVELAIVEGAETTTDTIALRDRLSRAYAATSTTVESAAIYYDLNASDTDTWPVGLYYQALFSASSWASVRPVVFRLVDLQTLSPIAYEDVRKWIPYASDLRDAFDAPGLDEARANAWSFITAKLRASGRDPAVLRDADTLSASGGVLAAAFFLFAHDRADLAHELAGDPIGSGGMWALMWQDASKCLVWYDEDQDRTRSRSETRPLRGGLVGRGL
jgi:hypothetical protein